MRASDAVVLETPLEARVDNCIDDYVTDLLARFVAARGEDGGFDAFAEHHRGSLSRIVKRLGAERHAEASRLLDGALEAHARTGDTGAYRPFVELLLVGYYDPMYDYQLASRDRRTLFTGDADAILDWVASGMPEATGEPPAA